MMICSISCFPPFDLVGVDRNELTRAHTSSPELTKANRSGPIYRAAVFLGPPIFYLPIFAAYNFPRSHLHVDSDDALHYFKLTLACWDASCGGEPVFLLHKYVEKFIFLRAWNNNIFASFASSSVFATLSPKWTELKRLADILKREWKNGGVHLLKVNSYSVSPPPPWLIFAQFPFFNSLFLLSSSLLNFLSSSKLSFRIFILFYS